MPGKQTKRGEKKHETKRKEKLQSRRHVEAVIFIVLFVTRTLCYHLMPSYTRLLAISNGIIFTVYVTEESPVQLAC